MLYNIYTLYLQCVFHGIRFKVNKDWGSGTDTLLFFIYPYHLFLINLSSTHTSYKYKQQHSCETFKSSLYSKAKKNVKRFANPSNT